jgi:hypothetical protein
MCVTSPGEQGPIYSTEFEPGEAKKRAVRETLISWYYENARDLPWRRTRDPWRGCGYLPASVSGSKSSAAELMQ